MMLLDNEIREIFKNNGFTVNKIKRWNDGQVDVEISRRDNLVKATELGNRYYLVVCRPM